MDLRHTKKGLLYDRKTVIAQGPILPMEWNGNNISINGGGSVILVGIIRGNSDDGQSPIYRVSAPDVSQLSHEIILPEWIYKLYVNGRRILNPERYLKRKGIAI